MADTFVERIELDADLANVALARRAVRDGLDGVSSATVDDLQLIVSELVTNAVEHGPGGPIAVELRRDSDSIAAVVVSPAPSNDLPDPNAWLSPGADATSGRGLAIVRQLADDVAIEQVDGTLVVAAHRRL